MILIVLFSLSFFSYSSLYTKTNSTSLLMAQANKEVIEENFVLEEGDEKDEDRIWWDHVKEYWNKHLRFVIGTSSTYYYKTNYLFYNYAFLSFEQSFFNWMTIKLAGEIYRSDINIALKIDESEIENEDLDRSEIALSYNENKWIPIFRDSFVQFDITQYTRLTIGRKTIVWGQFNVVSPVDIILPIRLQNTGLIITKANSRIPQDMISLGIYPTENIEIEGYYFPKVTIDPVTKGYLRQLSNPGLIVTAKNEATLRTQAESIDIPTDTDSIRKAIQDGFINPYDFQEQVRELSLPDTFNDLDETYQVGGRILFYLDFLTIGFTYFNGYYTLLGTDNGALVQVMSTITGIPPSSYVQTNASLFRASSYGFEMAIPIGRWQLKAELAASTRVEDIQYIPPGSLGFDPGSDMDQKLMEANDNFINWVINKNSSQLTINNYEFITGIGVDVEFDRWVMNILLLRLDTVYFGNQKKGKDLFDEYRKISEPDADDGIAPPVIPFINAGWYVTKDKKMTLGAVAGFLGSFGIGGSIYIRQFLFDDDFFWAVTLDALMLNSDQLIDDRQGADIAEPLKLGGRIILSYSI